MFELTNEQRKCFALPPVLDTWKKIKVPPESYNTYIYLAGQRIMRVIRVNDTPGQEIYYEYSIDQLISEDGTKFLPKTAKGKPQNFTVSHLEKKTPIGMSLYFARGVVAINNNTARQSFYCSAYEDIKIESFNAFKKWIYEWCENTGNTELTEIDAFSEKTRIHQKYKEGDFSVTE